MKEESQGKMINEITDRIKDLGKDIRENNELSTEDKLYQMDVLLDTMKFLENYDENVVVLNKHYAEKRWERYK